MSEKDRVAALLAAAHHRAEPALELIVRLVADDETGAYEPVKLLEVNSATSPSGVVPIAFGAEPPAMPYPSVVVEVTPSEYEQIRAGRLALPHDWRLGDTLYARTTGGRAHALTFDLLQDERRPYFLWDEDVSIAQLRATLRAPSSPERDRLLGKMLREARDTDVWAFVTPRDVAEALPRISRRLGRRAPFWRFLIEGWRTDGLL